MSRDWNRKRQVRARNLFIFVDRIQTVMKEALKTE